MATIPPPSRFAIVMCCDQGYVPYTAVTISSIVYNSDPDIQYDLYLLHENITLASQEALQGLAASKPNVTLQCIKVDAQLIKSFHLQSTYINYTTYLRFFIPQLFANQYDRALYIDCDLVVHDSLKELVTLDLGDYLIAGVRCGYCSTLIQQSLPEAEDERFNRQYNQSVLKMKQPENYINAGVLLFNLHAFKEQGLENGLFDIVQDIKEPVFADQCLINAFLDRHGGVLLLDDAYNINANGYLGEFQRVSFDSDNQYALSTYQQVSTAKIVHFAGSKKPWEIDLSNSFYFLFYAYMLPSFLWQEILDRNPKLIFDWNHRGFIAWLHARHNPYPVVFNEPSRAFYTYQIYNVFSLTTLPNALHRIEIRPPWYKRLKHKIKRYFSRKK